MTVNTTTVNQFSITRLALSHIQSFGATPLDVCYFDYTYTYSVAPINGQSVTVQIISPTVTTGGLASGIVDLPGGGVFSPWSTAGERAPVSYPTYSQRVRYVGDIRPVMLEYEKLMKLVGVTSRLQFAYGRIPGGGLWEKYCQAVLMPVVAVVERTLDFVANPTAKTWLEFSVNFRQVGDFVPV